MKRELIFFIVCTLSAVYASAQRMPLDFSLSRDFYFQQLLLNNEPTVLNRNQYYSDSLRFYHQKLSPGYSLFYRNEGKQSMRLLPVEQLVEYNSRHPYGWNNGSMLRSRGTQTLTRLGVWFKYDWLEIQYQPEIVYSEQLEYLGFPTQYQIELWRDRYINWRQIDFPETWTQRPSIEWLTGQTQVNLRVRGLVFGYSNRNFWMGPGIHQSLLMTNNARALPRLFIETQDPLDLGVMGLHFNLFGGIASPSLEIMSGNRRRLPSDFLFKENRDRYFNGLTIELQPNFMSGLSIGLNRVLQLYMDNAREFGAYFPVFNNLFRENDNNELELRGLDQVISIYLQLVMPDNHAMVSLEYGRNDAALKMRDYIMSPSHSFAYNFSMMKYFIVNDNQRFTIQLERTRFETTNKDFIRGAGSWYENSRVPHGYTNFGEIIGSGIGQGSNLTYASIGYSHDKSEWNVYGEYLVNDVNFQVDHLVEKPDWTTTCVGLVHKRFFGPIITETKVAGTFSSNYQWILAEEFESVENNPKNLHIVFKTAYTF